MVVPDEVDEIRALLELDLALYDFKNDVAHNIEDEIEFADVPPGHYPLA